LLRVLAQVVSCSTVQHTMANARRPPVNSVAGTRSPASHRMMSSARAADVAAILVGPLVVD
jgi:hypothetical protein